ncbi:MULTISPECIES: hypothetical protein [unclassified Polaromonas]|uniref:hypothetical protein n=1 Tax=unclassified Polaromonas TaxID=2638319 RepID=UPI000F08F5E7|nr:MULTISPECIES: hypothetical protein [unclassified Polaromonas]AYQ26567.1 hypothetical protein DT070_00045 [Polaromonas sp. SP1]QGJ18584.1 hypothetical protein F7R28_09390 [Polaromonas sp. Pch-P]
MNLFNMFKPKGKPMALICPSCHKEDVTHKNLARKIGCTIGALAGAASGVSGILSAARLGLVVGTPAGPAAALLTAIASATLRGIAGATAGGGLGHALGSMLDKHVLQSDSCPHCGFSYVSEEAEPMSFRQQPWPHAMAFPIDPESDDDDPDRELSGGMPSLT